MAAVSAVLYAGGGAGPIVGAVEPLVYSGGQSLIGGTAAITVALSCLLEWRGNYSCQNEDLFKLACSPIIPCRFFVSILAAINVPIVGAPP